MQGNYSSKVQRRQPEAHKYELQPNKCLSVFHFLSPQFYYHWPDPCRLDHVIKQILGAQKLLETI